MFQINVSQRIRSCLALALAALPLLPMAGCAAVMGNLVKAEKAEQRSFSVSGQPSVIVDTFNGPITVKAASEGKVEAVVTKIGSGATMEAAQADLENVIVNYSQDGRHHPDRRQANWSARLRLFRGFDRAQGALQHAALADDQQRCDQRLGNRPRGHGAIVQRRDRRHRGQGQA